MSATHFTYRSADKLTDIHAIEWKPDSGRVTAVVQIAHGMQEFIERYEDFALFLNSNDILVVGNDHLGHGGSVRSLDRYGYFAEKNGNKALLSDMRQLQKLTQADYPDVPYILLGHSMGSFLARQYMCMYGKHLDAAIISGTAYHTALEAGFGKILCSAMARVKGWNYRSPLVTKIVMGNFNKRFEPARTKADWLTRDEKVVDAYIADDRTHHTFTLNGYYNMFVGLKYLTVRSNLERIPYTLPVLLIAGEMDPVGNFGAGVRKTAMQLKNIGMTDVKCVMYPNDRHEVLNELNKADVYADVLDWILEKCGADEDESWL